MNWTRGLLRLWVVASIAWAAITPFGMVDMIRRRQRANSTFDDLVPLQPYQIADIVMAAVVPPLAVLLAFLILRWIWQGFRS